MWVRPVGSPMLYEATAATGPFTVTAAPPVSITSVTKNVGYVIRRRQAVLDLLQVLRLPDHRISLLLGGLQISPDLVSPVRDTRDAGPNVWHGRVSRESGLFDERNLRPGPTSFSHQPAFAPPTHSSASTRPPRRSGAGSSCFRRHASVEIRNGVRPLAFTCTNPSFRRR